MPVRVGRGTEITYCLGTTGREVIPEMYARRP